MEEKALKEVRFAKAADVMTKNVAYINGNETVANAIGIMKEIRISSLIVNRRGPEDTWGIITRKDVVSKVVSPGRDPHAVFVFEIMTKPLVMVSPDLELKYCARLFNQAGIRRAPVFDGKDIVGILSNSNIFFAIEV
ncbi:MAG: CBS domain-containing protein [Candidatus Aminicenantes bacterium]|nr:CBS domain-containing protein [Candidatus Aminicenantes bacterium]